MKKTSKILAGISSTALLVGLTGCGPAAGNPVVIYEDDLPPVPQDSNCLEWEWDLNDGVWECEDSNSAYYGHYYHGGKFFKTKSSLLKDKNYLSYKNSSSYKGTTTYKSSGSSSSVSKGSSGFGSGSKSFGG